MYLVLGVVTILGIIALLPYGRRFSLFYRWMLGSVGAVVLATAVLFLGALAICAGMGGGI
jgi:hypothetical protein